MISTPILFGSCQSVYDGELVFDLNILSMNGLFFAMFDSSKILILPLIKK